MKENANPIVVAIPERRRSDNDTQTVGYSCIQRFNFDRDEDASYGDMRRTAEERAVHLALMSISSSEKKKLVENPVGLLQNAGFVLPSVRNTNPFSQPVVCSSSSVNDDDEETFIRDQVTAQEIFDMIRNIQDPEHPLTLEQLSVVNLDHVKVQNGAEDGLLFVDVRFTPTIPHCSMATLIGLCIRVKLLRSLVGYKVTVRINPGTHASEHAVNKQLDDKERVCAALENTHLLGVVNRCIGNGMNSIYC